MDDFAERDASSAGLPTGEVARRLGVSPVTLRSWERRYGLGPADRADGRHRRWTGADIARLAVMCRLTADGVPPAEAARLAAGPPAGSGAETAPEAPGALGRQPAGDGGAGGRARARGLVRAAERLDGPAVAQSLRRAVAELGILAAWEDVMTPALRAAGRSWVASGERYVAVEHLLSWHVSAALRQATDCPAVPGPPVLLAAVPGERHSLPLDALAALLSERGVGFRTFGAAVPAEALLEACRRLGPAAVLLWSQTTATADAGLPRAVLGGRWGVSGSRRHPAVLLAGPGWRAGSAPAGCLRPRSLSAALALLTGLRLPQPGVGASTGPEAR